MVCDDEHYLMDEMVRKGGMLVDRVGAFVAEVDVVVKLVLVADWLTGIYICMYVVALHSEVLDTSMLSI